MPLNVDRINAGSILINGSPILNLYETGSGYCSTVRSGINSIVSGDCSVIAGGYYNTIIEISCASTISGGRRNTTVGRFSTIGGGCDNQSGTEGFVDGWNNVIYGGTLNNLVWEGPFSPSSGSTLSGYGAEFSFYFNGMGSVSLDIINRGFGYKNGDVLLFNGNLFSGGATPTDNVTFSVYVSNNGYATVGGGKENTASGEYSTISGGYENTASGYASTVSGGYQNETRCSYSTVSGGYQNTVLGRSSTISGGYDNTVSGYYSIINGGCRNTISGTYSTISGGYDNTALGDRSIINGGGNNTVANTSNNSSILGGFSNVVTNANAHVIGSGISSTADDTLHINSLHFSNIPTSSAGLATGMVWSDSGMLCIV
jgi:hypothetical protein